MDLGQRIDNFSALQPQRGTSIRVGAIDNLVDRLALDSGACQGRGDLAFGENDEMIYVYPVAAASSFDTAKIYGMKSSDYGKTWTSPIVILEEASHKFIDPYLRFDLESNEWFLACSKVDDADDEDAEIVVVSGGDILSATTSRTVNQPFALKNRVGGRIVKASRYLFMPVYGYEATGGDDTPVIMRSSDGGVTWSVYKELGGTGQARSVFSIYDNTLEGAAKSNIFCLVGNINDTENGYLFASRNGTTFTKYNLPFVINRSCDFVEENGVFTFFAEARSTVGYNEICFHTINGFEYTPAESLGGSILSLRKPHISQSGAVYAAVNSFAHKSSRYDSIGLQQIILPNKDEVRNSVSKKLELIPRVTSIADDASYTTRQINTDKPNLRFALFGNSAPTGLEFLKVEIIYYYLDNLVTETENITKFLKQAGAYLHADVKLKYDSFKLKVTNESGSTIELFSYGTLENVFGFENGKETQERSLAVTLDGQFETNSVGQGMGAVRNLTATNGINESTTNNHVGFHGICLGRDGDILLVYRDAADHDPGAADLYLTVSKDLGRTWSSSVRIYNSSEEAVSDPDIMYDFVSDSYILVFSEYTSIASGESDIVILKCSSKAIRSASAWVATTVAQPYNELNRAPYAPIRRGKDYLYMTAYGHDAEDTSHPALLKSANNGSTWTVAKTFDTVDCNECTLYWRHDNKKKQDVNFLLCRDNSASKWSTLLKANSMDFTTFTESQCDLFVSGGANVQMMGDYFLFIGRNNVNSSVDSSGITSYSIDGETWSSPEYNGLSYPVQPKFVKLPTGRLLVTSCVEASNGSSIGNVTISEFNVPSYIEVKEKLKGVDIAFLPRFTTIENTESYTTDFYELQGKELDIRFRVGSGTLGAVAVAIQYFYQEGDVQTVDVSDDLDFAENAAGAFGRTKLYGKFARIKVTNNSGAPKSLMGFIRSI